jgi:hypothetical protein
MNIPKRKIDTCDRLCERAGLARLQCENGSPLRHSIEDIGGIYNSPPNYCRRKDFVDESGPMFRTRRWKVAPNLAPPDLAVLVLCANEDRRPVQHPPKRRHHRRR